MILICLYLFQNVFRDTNIKSNVLTFRSDAPDLRSELIRVLIEAKKIARGKFGNHKIHEYG